MEENQLEIDLSFTDNVKIGDKFSINILENNNKLNINGEFVKQRTGINQIERGENLIDTITNLNRSLTLDHGNISDIKTISNGVKIITKNGNWQYVDSTFTPGMPININPQVTPISIFKITSIEFFEAANFKCNKVKVRITTNQNMSSYCINQTCNQVNSTSIEFEWFRGISFTVDIVNSLGTLIQRTVQTPNTIETLFNKISLNILNSLQGGSVTIIAPFVTDFNHQYSLDNINWQDSNSFNGLLEGNYTAYIKDQYGCRKEIKFSINPYVNNIVKLNDFQYISKANSIRFAKRDDFSTNHKTDENTLSCEMDVIKPYKAIQLFNTTDIITTQFKSNYENHNVLVLKEDGNNDSIPIIKKTDNIGLKEKRTAIKFNAGNGLTGIYFLTGNILDFDTNAVLSAYELNGFLPEWAKKGNTIQMENTWFKIIDIIFDELKNADIILINNYYVGNDTNTVVAAKYNRENYDVFEFTIPMASYQNRKVKVQIEVSSEDEVISYLSEEISVKDLHPNTLEIRYQNTKNTDIVYSTGIEHLLRIPYDANAGKDVNNSENHKTDDRTILLDAKIYESNSFKFEPLTKELWRKLKIALSHDLIFIDSIGYVKDEDFETEGPLGQTNLYILSATMIKTGQVYSNKESNDNIIIGDIQIPDIIGLIGLDGQGFIQHT